MNKTVAKMFKRFILVLCAVMLLLLIACKQDATPSGEESSTATQSSEITDTGSQNTTSGIELEEDVFDDSDIQSNPSKNSSTGNASDGNSSDKTVSDKNESTGNTSGDTSLDENPDTEDSNSSQEGVAVEDGVIKLPIDKFD